MRKLCLSRVFFLTVAVVLLVGSCFPSLEWPNESAKIIAPILERIELYSQVSRDSEAAEAVIPKTWQKSWRTLPVNQSLIRDYALTANIIQARYFEIILLDDLQESSLDAIDAAWNDGTDDPELLLEAGLRGLFNGLDPYSRYMNAAEYSQLAQLNRNQLSGIGVQIEPADEGLRIIRIFPGSTLIGSDVSVGSLILAADGTNLAGMTISDAVSLIKGEEGTQVKLQLKDPVSGMIWSRLVERRIINLPSVSSENIVHDDNVFLVIEIHNFNARTARTFRDKIENAFDDQEQPPQGIVIDLRNNPGGSVGEVVSMVDSILSSGMILRIAYRDDDTVFTAHRADIVAKHIPIAILTNRSSASAAEIFAGSLQSAGRATVLGDTSFGKTLVQRTFGLSEGRGLKLTIGRYFVYGNRLLDDGVAPDIMIEDKPDIDGDEIFDAALVFLAKGYDETVDLNDIP